MAISYSVENEASATECTEAEVKKKPENEKQILNDDDATKAAEKTQEDANPDKDDEPDLSESVYEIDEGVKEVVGIAAAATAAVGTISALSINSARHKGDKAVKSAIGYISSGYDSYKKRHLKKIGDILSSNKEFQVSKTALEFSKDYVRKHKADISEAFKILDEAKSKYLTRVSDAQIATNATMSEESLHKIANDTESIVALTGKANAVKEKLGVKLPKAKGDFFIIKNTDLIKIYREIEGVLDDGADSIKEFFRTAEAYEYSETDVTSTTNNYGNTVDAEGNVSVTHTQGKVETRRTPNSVFKKKVDALLSLYSAVNECYVAYVRNSLYYLSTAKNSIFKKTTISEDATPEDKLALAKALVEEVQCEQEFTKLLEEGAVEMCLDEDYVKKELRKEAILNGKLMKEAKAHSKAAKKAVKASDIDKAIEEQEAYVNILKQLLEECNDIKDDSKMVLVTNAVITGLLAGLASMMICINPVVWHAGKRFAPKLAAGDMDFNSDEDADAAYGAIKKHFGDKVGKIELAANTVAGIVAAIVAGKLKYDKQILKYGADVGKGFKLGVPKSRIEAQQRLRRMVRLAEQLLREYKDIKRIESKG